VLAGTGLAAIVWWGFYFLLASGTENSAPSDVLFPSLLVIVLVSLLVTVPGGTPEGAEEPHRLAQLALALVIGTSVVVSAFSTAYFAYRKDFEPPITGRVDAIYVAVGNLSTAGYPEFAPRAEATGLHRIIIFQYLADMFWVLVVVGTGVQQIYARAESQRLKRQPPDRPANRASPPWS
jgi:hypothetical protein